MIDFLVRKLGSNAKKLSEWSDRCTATFYVDLYIVFEISVFFTPSTHKLIAFFLSRVIFLPRERSFQIGGGHSIRISTKMIEIKNEAF